MSLPTVNIELPFGEAKLIAHSSRSVLVRSLRENGSTQYWRVNGVDYVGDAHLVRDESGWRPKDWTMVYLRRPHADREPTQAALQLVREGVVAAVSWWAGTPEGRQLLAAADAADRDDAVERLREKAREFCERAAELRALAKRVASGEVSPEEGRKVLTERRW